MIEKITEENVKKYNLTGTKTGYKMNCPYHKENTPSLHINKKMGVFHCFGCGKSGSVKQLANYVNEK